MIQKIRIFLWKIVARSYPWWLKNFYKMDIGENVFIAHTVHLDKSNNPKGIHIGDYSRLAREAMVMSHDIHRKLYTNTIIQERCIIGARAILLPGVKIGRGSVVGAGSVVGTNMPPYSICSGNPAKVIGFKHKPEEIIEIEKRLYPEEKRISLEELQKNYKKYFVDRIKIIIDSQK